MSRFKIYKASAGSGKTYSLVYEYLKILIHDPGEYKHILAVTFTNDATDEMKTRVLNQLKILTDDPESSSYIQKLREQVLDDVSLIQKRAKESLHNILHDYSNFNISTIDTFFQKILRAFAKDIGLSAAYNLQLDTEMVVKEITERVIANTSEENKQSKWLMKAAIEKIEDGKNWNIREELKFLFKETFKEGYQTKEEKIKESFRNEDRIEELQDRIKKEMADFENGLQEISEECNQVLKKYNLTRSSFSGKDKSFYGWVLKIGNGDFDPPGNSFLKARDNVEKWYTKSGDASTREAIILIYNGGLNALINKLYKFYTDHIEQYNSNVLIKNNLSYFVMFESMAEEMAKYKNENDLLFISDTNQFIHEIIGNNDESFIFEKAGNYFHHYLIDEFQDTSQLQWKNFKPLISNSVSQGYTSLVVGDVKQSIYRFRNGDWRLLHEQAASEITHNEIVPLEENHRSFENIIRFNNTLYDIAPDIVANIYQTDVELSTQWESKFKACYAGQRQLVPNKNKGSGGFVKVNLFTKLSDPEQTGEDDLSTKSQQLNELVTDIEDALKRGYQPNHIAILVFTKKEAYTVANHLREYVEKNNLKDRVNIVTQSSLNIASSHTVRLIIVALKYLSNKKDLVSLSNAFSEYEQYFLKNTGLDFLKRDTQEKIIAFKKATVVLKSFPLQILMEHIILFFELELESNEHIFLQHFKDAVYEYLRKNPDDLTTFMDWWEESYQKFQVEVPQNEKSLQIITIHKSKGLEFDLVFVPFAEWSLDNTGNKSDLLWLDLNENGIKTIPVKYDKKMLCSSFNEEYLENKFYNYLDRLNLLYVATTRAVKELYIYSGRPKLFDVDKPPKDIKTIFCTIFEREFSVSGDLYFKLSDYKKPDNNELIIGERTSPSPALLGPGLRREGAKGKEEFEMIETSITSGNIFETLSIKQQSTDLRDEKEVKYESLKQTGILFHGLIAQSNSMDEASINLKKLLCQRKIDETLHAKFLNDLQILFDDPLMKEWMKNYSSFSEYSFCIQNKILKPDKFFINDKEAIVIDFKTGKPLPEYKDQVKGYCNAISVLFNKPAKGYVYYTQTHQMDLVA